MEQDFSLTVEEFRQSLINIANTAELPPAVIYYVFKDVYANIADTYREYLAGASRKQVQPPQDEVDKNE